MPVVDLPTLELPGGQVCLRSGRVELRGEEHALRPREREALVHLWRHRDRVVPREELLREIWGYDPRAVTRTVDQTIFRLRRALELDPASPRVVLTAYGAGYRLDARTVENTPPRHNLTLALTRFVGRRAERERLDAWLADPARRLITLTGIGGMGKTRLAIEVAHQQARAGRWQGVWWVPLAGVVAEELPAAIGRALGLHPADRRPLAERLRAALEGRRTLLVLDEFEGLLEAAPELDALLERLDGLWFLVTSRARLAVRSESVLALDGLDDPLALFADRAEQARWDFALTDEARPSAERICALLEGVPLALEMAAALVAEQPLDALAERLAANIGDLASPLRDLPPRQRSLSAAFRSTWERLPEPARAALGGLSVFAGPFTAEAARAVAGADAPLDALVRWAVVRDDGEGRYALLEQVRAFAAEATDPEALAAAKEAHRRWYLDRLGTFGPALWGPDEAAALEALAPEFPNVRAAWLAGVEPERADALGRALIDLGALVERYLEIADLLDHAGLTLRARLTRNQRSTPPALEPVEEALAVEVEPALRASLLRELGRLRSDRGDLPAAEAAYREALAGPELPALARAQILQGLWETMWRRGSRERAAVMDELVAASRACGSARCLATALHHASMDAYDAGDVPTALALLRELDPASLTPAGRVVLDNHRGNLARARGDHAEAAETFQRVLDGFRRLGVADGRVVKVRINLAVCVRELGDLSGAVAHLRQALALARELGDRDREGDALLALGSALRLGGRLDEALAHYASANAVFRTCGDLRNEALVGLNEGGLLLELGRAAEALAALRRCGPQLERIGAVGLVHRCALAEASALALLGDAPAAATTLASALAFFEARGATAELLITFHAGARVVDLGGERALGVRLLLACLAHPQVPASVRQLARDDLARWKAKVPAALPEPPVSELVAALRTALARIGAALES